MKIEGILQKDEAELINESMSWRFGVRNQRECKAGNARVAE